MRLHQYDWRHRCVCNIWLIVIARQMSNNEQRIVSVWRFIAPVVFVISCMLFYMARYANGEAFTYWNFTLAVLIYLSVIGCIVNTVRLAVQIGRPNVLLPLMLNALVVLFMGIRVILDAL